MKQLIGFLKPPIYTQSEIIELVGKNLEDSQFLVELKKCVVFNQCKYKTTAYPKLVRFIDGQLKQNKKRK